MWSVKVISLAALAGVSAVAILPTIGLGFGTVNRFGQHAEHERITRAALHCAGSQVFDGTCFEPLSLDQVAGRTGTFGGVGTPDSDEIHVAAAHCDNADFVPGFYFPAKQQRKRASEAILRCRDHLRQRFNEGINAAEELLDSKNRIVAEEVDIDPSCTFTGGVSGRAKCNVIEGFGRLLHGAQDFYSHSNWADSEDPKRSVSLDNPPGLNYGDPASLLDMLRGSAPGFSPYLTTGCFALSCSGRVKHSVINKDKGVIDPDTGAAIEPSTPRGKVGTNFQKAVKLAIRETRRQWEDFAFQLVKAYGRRRANLMLCALTRDDPVNTCQGRDIVFVIDSSESIRENDRNDLRFEIAQRINAQLVNAQEAGDGGLADRSAVVGFDTMAKTVSPLADPAQATFSGLKPQGSTSVASGLNAAVSMLTSENPTTQRTDGSDTTRCGKRCGIVLITDGEDYDPFNLLAALQNAYNQGIRISFVTIWAITGDSVLGFGANRTPGDIAAQASEIKPPPESVMQSLLKTGGSYNVVGPNDTAGQIVKQIESNGLTYADDANGIDDGGWLEGSVRASGRSDNGSDSDSWAYSGRRGEHLAIRVNALASKKQSLRLTARDVGRGQTQATAKTFAGDASLGLWLTRDSTLRLVVATRGGVVGPYTVDVTRGGKKLRGGKDNDSLRCKFDQPTYVRGGPGDDRISCGARNDLLVGGPGTDRVWAEDGDDLFLVKRNDLRRGREQLLGGAGTDTVRFAFRKPRGTRCRGQTITIRVSQHARYVLSDIERVVFAGKTC